MTTPDSHNRFGSGNTVSAQEADALDQWLERASMAARRADTRSAPTGETFESARSPRHVERSRDISRRSDHSPNGAKDESLAAVAQRAHATIAAAERHQAPEIPVDAIWEKIMASATTHPISPRMAAQHRQVVIPRNEESSRRSRPIPALLSGSHWAVSAVLIASLVVGILALYQSFAGTPGGDDEPATNPGLAFGTPGSTPALETAANLAPISPASIHASRRRRKVVAEQVASAIRQYAHPKTSTCTSLSKTTRSGTRGRWQPSGCGSTWGGTKT